MTPSPVFFSDGLISEIFSVLPVKSVLRFKCLNNSCNTLISDPSFVKLHLKRSTTRNTLLTINTQHIWESDHEKSDYEHYHRSHYSKFEVDYCLVPISISQLIEKPSFTLSVDPYYQWRDNSWSDIVGFCNGLICFTGSVYGEQWLRLWNPATKKKSEKMWVFSQYNGSGNSSFSFGCDNLNDTYKLVGFDYSYDRLTNDVRILSLGDNVWRNIESFPVIPFRLSYEENDVYFSGSLNWLAIHNDFLYSYKNITVEQFVIVSLDLGTETYNQYRLPSGFDEVPREEPTIGVLDGCLCFSYSYRETDFVIWKMNEFGVEDSWTQFLKVSYQNLHLDYEFNEDTTKHYLQLVPLLLSGDGDTLILRSSQDFQAILYNLKDNRVERTDITTSRIFTGKRTSDYVCWNFFKAFVESLVPII
ncbi:hypothetical protein TSUD_174570 [Trifolium subterraneum]|uniref:F-box associated beta-propeller type 3 domain-containing protein n=1 Tax=Trifolium subterraneum TaxID=3900 RepID=A0A2Z6PFF0_TRISU|nr:hypothetical protein TSUD_174570 [Trifolium subterraneum]